MHLFACSYYFLHSYIWSCMRILYVLMHMLHAFVFQSFHIYMLRITVTSVVLLVVTPERYISLSPRDQHPVQ